MNDMGKNDRLTSVTEQATDAARTLVSSVMAAAGMAGKSLDPNAGAVEAIVGGVATIAGGLHTLAAFLNKSEDIQGPVTSDETLFTALLVWHCSPANDGEKSTLVFDPSLILDAMESFERFTGRKPDGFMIPAMAQAARDCAAEGNAVLEKFRADRAAHIAAAERGNSPLN